LRLESTGVTALKTLSKGPKIIGIIDKIDLPEVGLFNLPCKIDSGADTSSIHCERIKLKEINGVEHVVFKLLDKHHPFYNGVEIKTSDFKEKKVTSSFGDYEFRYQVKLSMVIFNKKYKVAFNLSNRKNMKFPVLLGRRFLSKKFVVDVSQQNLSANLKIK
jgi:hypothetical protein